MAPRTLDAVPVPTLALWALRGLTALDPRLTPTLRDGTAAADRCRGGVVAARTAPDAADARGWGAAVAAMALRRLGRRRRRCAAPARRASSRRSSTSVHRPSRPVFALRPAGRGGRRPGAARRRRRHRPARRPPSAAASCCATSRPQGPAAAAGLRDGRAAAGGGRHADRRGWTPTAWRRCWPGRRGRRCC